MLSKKKVFSTGVPRASREVIWGPSGGVLETICSQLGESWTSRLESRNLESPNLESVILESLNLGSLDLASRNLLSHTLESRNLESRNLESLILVYHNLGSPNLNLESITL